MTPAKFVELHPKAAELDDERLQDLYIATGCRLGDTVALAEFYRRYEPEIRAVGTRSLPSLEVDDFVQQVVARLLVGGEGSRPGIGQFAATGALGGFVRMTASRGVVDVLRRRSAHPDKPAELGAVVVGIEDPEGQLMSDETRRALRDALAETLGDLRPLERRALRMRYLLGFSVSRTARALQIREKSVSRLVSRLRASICRKTYERLGAGEAGQSIDMAVLETSIGAWLASHPALP